jgi:uncharacterized membrane protein
MDASNTPAVKGGNGMAVAGLVLGIVALLLCWFPPAGVVLGLVGLVLSIVGLAKSRSRGSGRGAAIAGLILSIVAIVLALVMLVVLAGMCMWWCGTADFARQQYEAAKGDGPASSPSNWHRWLPGINYLECLRALPAR